MNKVSFTYSEIKSQILQILTKEKFDRLRFQNSDKMGDLRTLLCGFAHKVWSIGSRHNLSAVQGINDEQESLACQKSLLQAISLDKQHAHINFPEKEKRIDDLILQIDRLKQHNSQLLDEQRRLIEKIENLSAAYYEAKRLFGEEKNQLEDEVKGLKTLNFTYCSYEKTQKQLDVPNLSYRLHIAQNFITNQRNTIDNLQKVINSYEKKNHQLSKEAKCLKIQMEGVRTKNSLLQQSNNQKKSKIEKLLEALQNMTKA